LKKTHHNKKGWGTGGAAQGVGPEFKPQDSKKEKQKQNSPALFCTLKSQSSESYQWSITSMALSGFCHILTWQWIL
jgi:hypothetical protein